MLFNKHSELNGRHALLSPSQYHWVNYDKLRLESKFYSHMSASRGTSLHDLAHKAILLGTPLAELNKALAWFVNDAIELGMQSEQYLYYSDNAFGQTDAIKFDGETLYIFDLKNGITPTKFTQLEIYAGLFCLEYGYSPFDMAFVLRIYQREEVREHEPTQEAISAIMDTIIAHDRHIEQLREADR